MHDVRCLRATQHSTFAKCEQILEMSRLTYNALQSIMPYRTIILYHNFIYFELDFVYFFLQEVIIEDDADKNDVLRHKRGTDKQYSFDVVFGEDSTQEQVYEHTTSTLVKDVLSG